VKYLLIRGILLQAIQSAGVLRLYMAMVVVTIPVLKERDTQT